jgi:hypothetical protein
MVRSPQDQVPRSAHGTGGIGLGIISIMPNLSNPAPYASWMH